MCVKEVCVKEGGCVRVCTCVFVCGCHTCLCIHVCMYVCVHALFMGILHAQLALVSFSQLQLTMRLPFLSKSPLLPLPVCFMVSSSSPLLSVCDQSLAMYHQFRRFVQTPGRVYFEQAISDRNLANEFFNSVMPESFCDAFVHVVNSTHFIMLFLLVSQYYSYPNQRSRVYSKFVCLYS